MLDTKYQSCYTYGIMNKTTTQFLTKNVTRNFVAKNAKVAGSGRHRTARDYVRQPKHKIRDFGQINH